jgi:hypothetical protein
MKALAYGMRKDLTITISLHTYGKYAVIERKKLRLKAGNNLPNQAFPRFLSGVSHSEIVRRASMKVGTTRRSFIARSPFGLGDRSRARRPRRQRQAFLIDPGRRNHDAEITTHAIPPPTLRR